MPCLGQNRERYHASVAEKAGSVMLREDVRAVRRNGHEQTIDFNPSKNSVSPVSPVSIECARLLSMRDPMLLS